MVVESPAKAKTIEKYLGGDYAVRASYGHIRDLPESKLGVDVERDFAVEYVVPEDSERHVAELRRARKAAGDVVLATDFDREGEAIAFHVATLLDVDPATAKRVTFTEITRDAILEAFTQPARDRPAARRRPGGAPDPRPPRGLQDLTAPVEACAAGALGRPGPVGGGPPHRRA